MDFDYERLAWRVLTGLALLIGYWQGYRAGRRDRSRGAT